MPDLIRRKEEEEEEDMGSKGEKSNFSQACQLLSQYLKEKGNLSGLGLGIGMAAIPPPFDQHAKGKSRSRATMNLLPGADVSGEEQTEIVGEIQSSPKSMDLFPQHSGFDSGSLPEEEAPKNSNSLRMEMNQLTIFYGGKVLVFDDFPANKADDLMKMASEEVVAAAQKFSFSINSRASAAAGADGAAKPDAELTVETPVGSTLPPRPETLLKPNASDMPIARRNSLHRFLEKRKDRITTKAPYLVSGSSSEAAPEYEANPESSHSWLNLGRQAKISQPEHSSDNSK